MRSLARAAIAGSLLLTLAGCHHQVSRWQDAAVPSGCTPALLAAGAAYDSTQIERLVGSYRFTLVDTTSGWVAQTTDDDGLLVHERPLRLWAVDSVGARRSENPSTGALVRATRSVAGAFTDVDTAGFSAENPAVRVSPGPQTDLRVRFSPDIVTDGPAWTLPIERIGSWGFGGSFVEDSFVIPVGRDGRRLKRTGYYCALRR